MREYIDIGVDGINSDHISTLKNIVNEEQFQKTIRIADRIDNPMTPANTSYSLAVHTGDARWSGTSANITLTLVGESGSSNITISAKAPYRMERNDWNFITLPSPDLGLLKSINVQLDNQGIAPDWFLKTIKVESFKYGASKMATFERWIDSTGVFSENLV